MAMAPDTKSAPCAGQCTSATNRPIASAISASPTRLVGRLSRPTAASARRITAPASGAPVPGTATASTVAHRPSTRKVKATFGSVNKSHALFARACIVTSPSFQQGLRLRPPAHYRHHLGDLAIVRRLPPGLFQCPQAAIKSLDLGIADGELFVIPR